MSEWWTYRPSDFLMFSPRIYWRLFASINESFWPAQPVLIVAGLAWLARARAQRLEDPLIVLVDREDQRNQFGVPRSEFANPRNSRHSGQSYIDKRHVRHIKRD